MKKILVTGGAGFIGSAVVRHIIRDTQDTVINLDKLTYAGNLESLVDVSDSERYYFEQVDICDRAELDRVFSEHQPDSSNTSSQVLEPRMPSLSSFWAVEKPAKPFSIIKAVMPLEPASGSVLA